MLDVAIRAVADDQRDASPVPRRVRARGICAPRTGGGEHRDGEHRDGKRDREARRLHPLLNMFVRCSTCPSVAQHDGMTLNSTLRSSTSVALSAPVPTRTWSDPAPAAMILPR